MRLSCNDTNFQLSSFQYAPAKDRQLPAELELDLSLPARSTLIIKINFEKVLMRIKDYPFDVHRGQDLPPALLFLKDTGERIFSTTLVAGFPEPDFPMPYNVIFIVWFLLTFSFIYLFNCIFYRLHYIRRGDPIPNKRIRMRRRLQGLIGGVFLRLRTRLFTGHRSAIWPQSGMIDEERLRYHVSREGGTEPPFIFDKKFDDLPEDAILRCHACENALFLKRDKFDSGTGWPSFTRAIDKEAVVESGDSLVRGVEIRCKGCGAHLGHIFGDGPEEHGGLRYCINGICLKIN